MAAGSDHPGVDGASGDASDAEQAQRNGPALRQVRSQGVAFLDVTNAIADACEKLGPEKVKEFFPEDHMHTSPAGADLNASLVVAALKGQKLPLAGYLSAKGQAVDVYPVTPAPQLLNLRLPAPANPNLPALFLIGDSTVRNGRADGANGQWGWGEPIVEFFDASKIDVVNRAVGGLRAIT